MEEVKINKNIANKCSINGSIRLNLMEASELIARGKTVGKGLRMAVDSFVNGSETQSASGIQINWENNCFDIDMFLAEEGLNSSEGIGRKIALWYWKSVFGVVVQGTTTDEINKKIDKLEALEF